MPLLGVADHYSKPVPLDVQLLLAEARAQVAGQSYECAVLLVPLCLEFDALRREPS